MGWQFTAGEFLGGAVMIVLMALLFRRYLKSAMVAQARAHANEGVLGRMEGHAEMDMSVDARGSVWRRLRSPQGFTATSNYFVMDWGAVWMDIVGGLLIAGALAAWVPNSFWQGLFLQHDGALATIWGPLVGPLVAIISFGGVLAFIFADLIILPILHIYRKYYGRRVAAFLLLTFYVTMAAAGLIVDLIFTALGLIPTGSRHAKVVQAGVSLDYTTVLNVIFLALAAILILRYFRKGGGVPMLRMMNTPAGEHEHAHGTA